MKDLQIFENSQFGQLRGRLDENDQPWFVAADVCAALEIQNASDALAGLDDDEKMTLDISEGHSGQRGGAQKLNLISEPGLYSLVLRSRKPEAKAFKRWITHEVVPAIRRTGGYLIAAGNATPEEILARAVLVAQDTIKRIEAKAAALEAQVAANHPKVVFAESVAISETTILIGELAKLISQAGGPDLGQNRLFAWLRNHGYLHKTGSQYNLPTQLSIENGWMVIKEGSRIGSSGESHITRTTKITGKGQVYFVNKFFGVLKADAA